MALLKIFRVLLALLALGSAMAGAASASAAMAKRSTPCHESAMSAAGEGHAAAGHVAPASLASAKGSEGTLHPPASDAVRLHLCCVLSQLVASPFTVPAIVPPVSRVVALLPPVGAALSGLTLATPVPPPRAV
ncbi:hypothetical protein [Starkeya nomas]|uniref:hypothetical protein n=1 Tax=Starkeya nomas TaxID=2666134 RepID=UPI00135CC1C8|nr:hypothetical protein [Starkeya nomas]